MTSERESMDIEPVANELEFREQLDRLVSGDLDESTRAKLIEFMGSDPGRWRACGIAFLEAQLWSEALLGQRTEHQRVSGGSSLEALHRSNAPITASVPQKHLFPFSIGTAATILIAFALGWMVDRGVHVMRLSPSDPKVQTEDGSVSLAVNEHANRDQQLSQQPVWATQVLSARADLPGARIQIPLDPNRVDLEENKIQLSTYEKQLMARQGFVIATERKFITAKLPDGRDVAVPIDRVVARQVGGELN